MNWKRTARWSWFALPFLLLAVWPSVAAAADATLYEVTENMALDNLTNPTLRTATAGLQGTAKVGTTACPNALLDVLIVYGLISSATSCTVTAVGSDVVNLTTGLGSLSGTFAVVVNADNPVDAPEFVVMTGSFSGDMQLAGPGVPIILLTNGIFTPESVLGMPAGEFGLTPSSFTGVFRLPFAMSATGAFEKPRRGKDAFYLRDDGRLIKVKKDEHSLGFPTVRVEITFD